MIPQLPVDTHYQLARELTQPRRQKAVSNRVFFSSILKFLSHLMRVPGARNRQTGTWRAQGEGTFATERLPQDAIVH
jgi:hypothetical protein